jgi:hypothetical protein
MRLTVLLLPALVLFAACKNEAPKAKEVPATARPVTTTATTATATSAGNPRRIDCQKLVPAALREKHFKGLPMKQEAVCPGCPEACRFSEKDRDPSAPSILLDCRGSERPGWYEQASKTMTAESSWKSVEGLGRVGFSALAIQVMFIPSKVDCVATLLWMGAGSKKLIEVAKDFDAVLTPASLK